VISPSSSKPEEEEDEDYYMENEEGEMYNAEEASGSSAASIPMAHREYEKILR